tara:strand:+ start:3923 stop:6364 length:2442 start_codon:yes stop_codon:yes gene_type:complete
MALLRMSDALAQVRANSKKTGSVGEALLEALEKDALMVDEGRMKDIYTMDKDGASAKDIAKKLGIDVKTVRDILGEEANEITEGAIDKSKFDSLKKGDSMTITYNSTMSGTTVKKFIVKSKSRSAKYNTDKVTMYPDGNPSMARFFLYKRANGAVSMATGDMAATVVSVKEGNDVLVEFSVAQLDILAKQYADMKGKTISVDNANKLRKIFDKIPNHMLPAIRKKKIPFLSALALSRMVQKGMPVKEDKENEEEQVKKELPKKKDVSPDADTEDKEKKIANLEDQIALLKQKLENEKNATIKPEPNKDTGEVPLTIGLAHKLLKKKEEMKENIKEYAGLGKSVGSTINAKLKYSDIRGTLTDKQLNNLRNVWRTKKASDVTQGVKDMLKKLDNPTKAAIAQAKIPHISDLVKVENFIDVKENHRWVKGAVINGEQGPDVLVYNDTSKRVTWESEGIEAGEFPFDIVEGFTDKEIRMAKGIAFDKRYKDGNYTGAQKMIDKIRAGLSKHPEVAKALKTANEDVDLGEELESLDEFKNMTVTFKDMEDMKKASIDLAKQGFSIDAKGLQMKVNGKGADLNKFATDLRNYYKANIRAESLEEEVLDEMAALRKKSDKSGIAYSILKKVFDRGMAAWKGGHRPGASQHQWAYARVNSFITKGSGTWGGADKDLAKQARGQKEDLDAVPQDKDVKKKDGTQPKKYYKGLSKDTKDARAAHFKNNDSNKEAPGDKDAKTKPSIHTQKYKKMFGEMSKDQAYAIGMAQAKKTMNDEPPLDKKTIKKAHHIADKILNKEEKYEGVMDSKSTLLNQIRNRGK